MAPRKVASRPVQQTIGPRKVAGGTIRKQKANRTKLFLKYFGNKDYQRPWTAESIASILHSICSLTGLISYESVFAGKQIMKSNLKDIVMFSILGGITTLNFIFLVTTTINELKKSAHSAMLCLPYVLTGAVLAVKGIFFCLWKKEFQQLIKEIMHLWNHQIKYGLDDEVIVSIKRAKYVMRTGLCLMISGIAACILRPLYFILIHIINEEDSTYFHEKVLPTQYPFAVDNLPIYVFCNLWEAYTVVHACICWFSTDVLLLYLSSLLSMNLQIVGIDLRRIVRPNDIPGRDSRLIKRLCKVAHRHSNLLTYCRRLDKLYSPAILSVIVYAALCLSICLINIKEEWSRNNIMSGTVYVVYCLGVLLQAAVYCNSTESISHWTANIAQELYNCDWTSRSIKFKKLMLMIMMRARNNYVFKAYGFYEVNRIQLTKIVMLTGNLFNVIRSIQTAEYFRI